jgi:HK97 family phage major capsid protein
MEFDLKAVETAIENANKAIASKADNASEMATKAMNKATELLDSLEKSKTANEAELKSLRDDYNEMASKLSKAKFEKDEPQMKSWITQFTEQYQEKEAEIKDFANGKQKSPLVFEMKEAVTVGVGNTIGSVGSAAHYNITQNTGIVSQIRKRVTNYLNNVSIGAISMDNPRANWIEELDEQGVPIFIGESEAKTAISVRYEEREAKAKKIPAWSKVSTEMIKYLPQLISFLQNNMMRRIDIATEQQLLTGDGTGNNLSGVLGYATAFTGGDMAGTLPAATINNWDVILAAISQARKAHGLVTGFYVKGGKLDAMLANKTTDGQYILPAGVNVDAQGNISAWGVPLYRTEANLGAFDFFGGDLAVINVGFTGAMTVQIERSGDDFTNNKRTMLVEQELVQWVSANDTQVLVKGAFESAKTLLEA